MVWIGKLDGIIIWLSSTIQRGKRIGFDSRQKDALRKSEADIYNIKAEYSEKTKKVGALESKARQILDDQQKANQEAEQRRSQMAATGAAQRKR